MPGNASSPRITLLVLASATAAFSMLQSLVSPALPIIQRDLHTSQGTVTWVLTAWLLAASVATPLLGRIGDMIGKKRTLLIALGAVAAGCLIAALAPTAGVLIVGRVVQGLGGAIFPLSFGIIRDEFPRERVPSLVGIVSAVIAAGGGLGIVLAGPVIQALNWRWLFWIPFLVVVLAAFTAFRFVPESPSRAPGRIDWLAAVLLSGWLVALLLPLSKAAAWGRASVQTIGLLVLAVVLVAGWITVELRSRNPLIDMRMMRLPAVWTTNLVALLFGAGMFAAYAFVPQFMQIPTLAGYGFGATVTRAGLLMLPMLVAMAVAGSLSGPIAPRFDVKAQLVLGSVFSLIACVAFAGFHDQAWQVALAGASFGLGIGLAYASMTSLIVQNVPMSQTGAASGMNANIRTIGGAIGTAVVSSIVTSHLQANGLPFESGYTHAFALLAVISAVAVVLALLVPTARRRAAAHPEPVLAGASAAPGE
ncbi:EmrB/QacA subfamily drug resistance transporter [Kribbella orskensis]|uniref:EmrB/QacA subfamily drug resistance transporter n=1 Tax=Kribbella orskensis TaxID=2512216 RepID=A0ABY2BDT1_9ACTN|nr:MULTISPECIES: MFS transporter [Kribbella]TCN35347.1 EmrB/QacA subfamily drug resistance transporter [Kribbella sp. VKM Ac-2500]TCO16768.1 EmrB/QacA subfamily drug resistance transporter [Kribbella orskensis]